MERKINKNLVILLVATLLFLFLARANALSSSTETIFSMKFDKPYCDFTSADVGWWESNANAYYFISWDSQGYECYKSAVEFGLKECCPIGYTCDKDNTNKCVSGGPASCKEFLTKDDCDSNDNHQDIAYNDLSGIVKCGEEGSYGDLCHTKTNCGCYWNSTSCLAGYNQTISKGNNIYSSPFPSDIQTICQSGEPPVGGMCEFTTNVVNNCDTTNKKIISWTAVWIGTGDKPGTCVDGETEIACVSGTLLSFFTLANLIIAVIIIVIFYLIVHRKRKQYRKAGKRR